MYHKITKVIFQDKDLSHDVYIRLLHRITQIYIIVMLLIFPFYCTNRYFHILRDRRDFFIYATCAYIIGILLAIACAVPREDYPILVKRCKLIRSDWLLLTFELCTVIGLFLSDNLQAVFWGSDGRYQGVLMWGLYSVTYLLISRFWHVNRVPVFCFTFGGLASSIWGITDFLGMDIFGWLSRVKSEQQHMFSSSYGNINTYTAALLLISGVAAGMNVYLSEKSNGSVANYGKSSIVHQKLYFSIVFFVSVVALIFGRSDNAALGLATILLILPYWAWKTAGGIKAYCFLMECVVMALTCSGYTLAAIPTLQADVSDSILLNVSQYYVYYSVPLLLFYTFILLKADKLSSLPYRRFKIAICLFYTVLGILGIGVVSLLVIAFLGKDMTFIPIVGRYFHFSDSWGAHRGYIWRAAVEEYAHLALPQKVFGVGLEMFGNLMRSTRYDEMIRLAGEFFDSPHNEFLQYLITTGCVGCVSLFGWVLLCCTNALRKASDGIAKACSVAVLSYLTASFVNISVPITQAIVIVLMGMITAAANNGERLEDAE